MMLECHTMHSVSIVYLLYLLHLIIDTVFGLCSNGSLIRWVESWITAVVNVYWLISCVLSLSIIPLGKLYLNCPLNKWNNHCLKPGPWMVCAFSTEQTIKPRECPDMTASEYSDSSCCLQAWTLWLREVYVKTDIWKAQKTSLKVY